MSVGEIRRDVEACLQWLQGREPDHPARWRAAWVGNAFPPDTPQ